MMVAHWAQSAPGDRPVKAALLATPADVEQPFPAPYPSTDTLREHGWLPVPRARLPFPSVLAASRNDPLCSFARAQAMAVDWGSEVLDLGEVGHLNPAAGYGEWPAALGLLARIER
jgi:predicted alpha/beta hydrolase family esterase